MRVSVPLRRAYKLINHGPTTLITSAADGRRNVMSAAWVMALDFDPAKLVAVIAVSTLTRTLVSASGEFVVNVPTAKLLDSVYAAGQVSGEDEDKFATLSLKTTEASIVGAPLLEGCAAWLECKVIPEPHMQERYDLFVADVVAAWADDASFVDGVWRFPRDEDRTLHHLSSGVFLTSGDIVKAKFFIGDRHASLVFMTPLLALAVAAAAADKNPASRITAAGLLADTKALSDDAMRGRGPGSPGDRMARAYLVKRLKEIGFEPGGPGGSWEQPFPIVGVTMQHPASWKFRAAEGATTSFRWWDEFIGNSGVQTTNVSIKDTEVVFAGYAIEAPEFQWDDFKGTDLTGKILLIVNNDPDWDESLFAGKKRLYYGRWDYKYESAARHGAAGAIIIHTEPSAGYGWNVVQTSWSGTSFELPSRDERRVRLRSWMTEEAARKLVRSAGKDLDALIASARKREFKPVPLGITTTLSFDVKLENTETANVVGILRGIDPALRDETIVYTAHHDHLGIGAPDAKGDKIYNGALDNASGCAQVLAIADAFAATEARRRSVIALFVGGEEQGLLGSAYYAAHPTIPLEKIVANINIDGGNIFGRTQDVAIIGRGKSDLEARLVGAAQSQRRNVVNEPEPDKGYYYRSDQLSFARVGVPALYFKSGQTYIGRPEGWGKEKEAEYRKTRYHQPSDVVTPEWDLSGMVEDAMLAYRVGWAVTFGGPPPAWFPGDEFEAKRKASAP